MINKSRKIYIYWVLTVVNESWIAEKNKEIAYNQIKAILPVYLDFYVIAKSVQLILLIWTWPIRKMFIKSTP